jgi:hypothetical protein
MIGRAVVTTPKPQRDPRLDQKSACRKSQNNGLRDNLIDRDPVLSLRRIDIAVAAVCIDKATAEYRNFAGLASFDVPVALKKTEPWSLVTQHAPSH